MAQTRVFGPGEFAAHLEQRMEQHRRWQHEAEHVLIEEIIEEVLTLPKRRARSGRLFDVLPEHVQTSIVHDFKRAQ